MWKYLTPLIYCGPPLIILALYVLYVLTGGSYLLFISVYATIVSVSFILVVYVFGVIEMGLYLCMRFIHLPASLFLADQIDEVWTRFGGRLAEQPHLWFYHWVCQTINCGALLLIRFIFA